MVLSAHNVFNPLCQTDKHAHMVKLHSDDVGMQNVKLIHEERVLSKSHLFSCVLESTGFVCVKVQSDIKLCCRHYYGTFPYLPVLFMSISMFQCSGCEWHETYLLLKMLFSFYVLYWLF